jgi:hypothetical protein
MTPTTDTNEPEPCRTNADPGSTPRQARDRAGHLRGALQTGVHAAGMVEILAYVSCATKSNHIDGCALLLVRLQDSDRWLSD